MRLTISIKLLLLVAAVILATLVSTSLGVYSTRSMGEGGRAIYTGLERVEKVSDLMITYQKQGVLVRTAPYSHVGEVGSARETFDLLGRQAAEGLAALKKGAPEEEGQRIDALTMMFTELGDGGQQVFAAAANGDATLAQTLVSGDVAMSMLDIEALLSSYQAAVKSDSEARLVQLDETAESTVTILIGLMIVLLLVTGGGSVVLVNSIRGPLRRMTAAVRRLAAGDHAVDVPALDRNDEIGDIARAVQVFKEDAQETEKLVRQVISSARQVAVAAGQASGAVGQVSDGAHAQLTALRRVAGALKQTSEAIAEVSRSTQSASDVSRDVAALVGDGRRKMDDMVAVVRGNAETAEKIDKIAESISRIADQTNMLALNAAIEAARAGENGRGFAVVADEVRKLAESSGELAQEIGELVRAATDESQRGVQMVEDVSGAMDRISDGVRRSDSLTAAIATSMEQQQTTVIDINESVDGLTQIGQSNAAAAEEITSTMVDLSRLAEQSRNQVERFARNEHKAGSKDGPAPGQASAATPEAAFDADRTSAARRAAA